MKKLSIIFSILFTLSLSIKATNVTHSFANGPKDTLDIRVPNVFSPNGDGVNDFWSILLYDYGIVLFDLQTTVYDRWGMKVFQSTNINQVWLGHTQTGRACSEGTYYYVITYTNSATGVAETLKGYVELVR